MSGHLCTCARTYTHMRTYARTQAGVHTRTYAHTHAHALTRIHTHTPTDTHNTKTYLPFLSPTPLSVSPSPLLCFPPLFLSSPGLHTGLHVQTFPHLSASFRRCTFRLWKPVRYSLPHVHTALSASNDVMRWAQPHHHGTI